MIERPWDPDGKYPGAVLKEYAYWVLEVSYRQHTLGSYIIFAKDDCERISELRPGSLADLCAVMADIERALCAAEEFRPDRFNYWQMGNALHRLHFHGIPRYAQKRVFAGQEWIDTTWGSVPVWSRNDVSRELVQAIRDALVKHL